MSVVRLHPDMLANLPAAVRQPAFDRHRLQPGIVHLGIGAFARAHLLPMTDAAIAAGKDPRWGVLGVSLRQSATRDALAPQQGLYALALRDADDQGRPREALQLIGSLIEVLVAPEDPGAVLRRIAADTTRIVSLTVTEKGYCHDPARGTLRTDHADIVHDRACAQAPRSAPGFIVRALQMRRAAGLGGVTLLSCDNLPGNGDTLRRVVLALAAMIDRGDSGDSGDGGLADWIAESCSFPNSMVDRIVPRTSAADRERISAALGCSDAWPVVGEPFIDWVVEDRFVAGRPDWGAGGARFVESAAPFEMLKLRMVNGCHSALAWLGTLAGHRTVDQAIAEPSLRGFVETMMRDEIEPTLNALPALDLAAYRVRLLQRFANPALQHALLQIAMDSSQKLPQRLLVTVRERLQRGQRFDRLALAVAAWLRFLQGIDEAGRTFTIDDPLAAALADDQSRHGSVLGFAPVFGDLAGNALFVDSVNAQVQRLQRLGVGGACRGLTSGVA